MTDLDYYKELADVRSRMIGLLRQGNYPAYSILIREEAELVKGAENVKASDISLRDQRKQNLVDALKSITRAVQEII